MLNNQKISLGKPKTITNIILFLLLAYRIYITLLNTIVGWYEKLGKIPSWIIGPGLLAYSFYQLFVPLLYLPIIIVIVLNKDELHKLNIDKPFLFLFLITGLIISFHYFLPLGKFCIGYRRGEKVHANIVNKCIDP